MKYAIIENGTVVNIAVADFPVSDNWIEAANAKIGDKWNEGQFFSVFPSPTVDMVKQEASRRITAICPEWKQRNLTARAAELAIKGVTNWTAEEQAEHAAGQAVWDQIKVVRARSDELEAMDPIPTDYSSDVYWS